MAILQSAHHPKIILTTPQIHHWASLAGWQHLNSSGIFNGTPNMNDQTTLFARANATPFEKLRTWAHDHETQTPADAETYLKAVSYIGVMYKGIRERSDSAHATARRIMAMPSILPDRWMELVEERRPRALAVLIHAFACGELVAGENFWFRGIAKRQIPGLCELLPAAWRPMVAWPLRVTGGDVDSEPLETRAEVGEL